MTMVIRYLYSEIVAFLKRTMLSTDYYIVVEIDSYGHYFRKAKSKLVCRSAQPRWNESFTLELEGSQNLRLLLYEDAARPVLRGKCTLKVYIL